MAKIIRRVNEQCELKVPKELPIREILVSEYSKQTLSANNIANRCGDKILKTISFLKLSTLH